MLHVARGILEEFRVEPGGVVLRLHSRSLSNLANGDHERQYLIGPDDRIQVTVHNHPELSATLVVSRAGTITMPHLSEVVAAGLTDRQLGDRIADLLAKNIVVDPLVDIQIHEFNSQWAMVSGEVRAAGKVPLRGGTDLKTVLAEAGGMTTGAGERIVISRPGPDGVAQTITVDRVAFEHGEQNPVLQHGDIVTVVRAAYCYVHGEVKAPGEIRIDRGMTLHKAIALAGGLTDWAKKKEVKIIYPDGDSTGVIYNLNDIENGKAEDPWLVGGEIIIVKRRFF